MDRAVIDHRGQEFAHLAAEVLEGVKSVFKTKGPVVIYPSSGSGAWEAAIVNTLSPGDRVLMFETGQFSNLWRDSAVRHGLVVDYVRKMNARHPVLLPSTFPLAQQVAAGEILVGFGLNHSAQIPIRRGAPR